MPRMYPAPMWSCNATARTNPPAEDFTDAAEIAAYFSGARDGTGVPVDYLRVRGVRKVAGARPGFVIYHTNWTAYVTPSEEKINRMRQK